MGLSQVVIGHLFAEWVRGTILRLFSNIVTVLPEKSFMVKSYSMVVAPEIALLSSSRTGDQFPVPGVHRTRILKAVWLMLFCSENRKLLILLYLLDSLVKFCGIYNREDKEKGKGGREGGTPLPELPI